MRVLGIDPGSLITGFGCVESRTPTRGGPDVTLIDGGVIRLNRGWPLAQRLVQLYDDVQGLIAELKPDLIAIESLFTHYQRPAPVIVMGHARGVILLACTQAAITTMELRPAEIKKATTGHGQAKKGQMQRAIAAELGLTEIPKPADVADALAIALCALRRSVLNAV